VRVELMAEARLIAPGEEAGPRGAADRLWARAGA